MFAFSRQLSGKVARLVALVIAIVALTPAAHAQFTEGYNFLKAVKAREGAEATQMIEKAGSGAVIINTRDDVSGEGALHIVVKERDAKWTGFLLQKGANPDIADKNKVTPLILATQLNFVDGIDWLVKYKAKVDLANRSGETPLIVAVQLNKIDAVRALLKAGADPDISDYSGSSARDYAARDPRRRDILALIERKEEPKDKKQEGAFDFSGIGEGPLQQ